MRGGRQWKIHLKTIIFFISLHYFGLQHKNLKLELTPLFNKYFENVKFKIILVNKQTIGVLFQYKDTKAWLLQFIITVASSAGLIMLAPTVEGWKLALLSKPESVCLSASRSRIGLPLSNPSP